MSKRTFYPFYKNWITGVINKIQKEIFPLEMVSSNIWLTIDSILYEIIHKAAAQTLIAEMHECLKNGAIKRSNAKEEYLSFMQLIEKEEYQEKILMKYPGLSYILDILGRNQHYSWVELFLRLKKDWHLI